MQETEGRILSTNKHLSWNEVSNMEEGGKEEKQLQ